MESSRLGIIYCPKQGVRHTHKRWEHIKEILDERQVEYDFVQSEKSDSVERLTRMLISNGYETLIIVGGDSALNRALNGLLTFDDEVRQRVVIGIIPNGRGNDFATFWGLTEEDDENTIDALIKRRLRKVDVGVLICPQWQGGNEGRRYFLNCVNVGLVANIMKLKYKTRALFGLSALSYFASMLLLLFQRMESRLRFQVNEEHIERKVMSVCIGNCRGYGQTPSAVPYNGMLDVSVISTPEVTRLLAGMWMLFTGKFLNHKNVQAFRTHRAVRFEDIKNVSVSADGRVLKGITAPFKIKLLPEHINFIIPS